MRWIGAEQEKSRVHLILHLFNHKRGIWLWVIPTILPLESKRPHIINKILPHTPRIQWGIEEAPNNMHMPQTPSERTRRKMNSWAYKKEGNSLLIRKRLQWIPFHHAPKPSQNPSAVENLNPTSPPNLLNVMRVSNVASKTGFADLLWETFLLLYTYIPLQMNLTQKNPAPQQPQNHTTCLVMQLLAFPRGSKPKFRKKFLPGNLALNLEPTNLGYFSGEYETPNLPDCSRKCRHWDSRIRRFMFVHVSV